MDLDQLRKHVIQETLTPLQLWSPQAEALLCATAANETHGGKYIRQSGGGPGVGIYQMEIKTHDALWRQQLSRPARLPLVRPMLQLFGFCRVPSADTMMWHLGYATFMARFFYLIIPEALPAAEDLKALWSYYKMYWNTEAGKATEQQFYKNVNDYIYQGKKREKSKNTVIHP